MVKLFVQNIELSLSSFWYHYQSNSSNGNKYKMIIPMDEKEIIDEIEHYAGCLINDETLTKKVIKKDKARRSLGLMWRLKTLFEEKSYVNTQSIESIDWTISDIEEILIKNSHIEIMGNIIK